MKKQSKTASSIAMKLMRLSVSQRTTLLRFLRGLEDLEWRGLRRWLRKVSS